MRFTRLVERPDMTKYRPDDTRYRDISEQPKLTRSF